MVSYSFYKMKYIGEKTFVGLRNYKDLFARKDIFNTIGWKYEVIASNIEEESNAIDPKQYVIDLSKDKANSVASKITEKALIVSADSIIYMDNENEERLCRIGCCTSKCTE